MRSQRAGNEVVLQSMGNRRMSIEDDRLRHITSNPPDLVEQCVGALKSPHASGHQLPLNFDPHLSPQSWAENIEIQSQDDFLALKRMHWQRQEKWQEEMSQNYERQAHQAAVENGINVNRWFHQSFAEQQMRRMTQNLNSAKVGQKRGRKPKKSLESSCGPRRSRQSSTPAGSSGFQFFSNSLQESYRSNSEAHNSTEGNEQDEDSYEPVYHELKVARDRRSIEMIREYRGSTNSIPYSENSFIPQSSSAQHYQLPSSTLASINPLVHPSVPSSQCLEAHEFKQLFEFLG